jgi:hypothetical protein
MDNPPPRSALSTPLAGHRSVKQLGPAGGRKLRILGNWIVGSVAQLLTRAQVSTSKRDKTFPTVQDDYVRWLSRPTCFWGN